VSGSNPPSGSLAKLVLDRRQFLAGLGALGAVAPLRVPQIEESLSPITILREPSLQAMRHDGVTIIWSTLEEGSGSIQYFSDDEAAPIEIAADSRIFGPNETGMPLSYVQYEATLNGLRSGTAYEYRPLVDGAPVSGVDFHRFQTAGRGAFDFLIFGDTGQNTPEQMALAERLASEQASFLLHTGDIAYMEGTFGQYHSNYFRHYGSLMSRLPFFTTPGNHDYMTNNAAPYLALHAAPREDVPPKDRGRYYSFDWANAHFVSIDSNLSLDEAINGGGPMLEWLENDLRMTRLFWRIAFVHHPPYAGGPNQEDPSSAQVRDYIVPILERYGVQLVFNGHEHAYHRSRPIRANALASAGDGTVYVTSGGGGAALYHVLEHPLVATSKVRHHYVRAEVRGSQLALRAIALDGTEIDAVTLTPAPHIAANGVAPAITMTQTPQGGTEIHILGRALAAEQRAAVDVRTFELEGVSVMLNGRRIPLHYVSANEIYARAPFLISGSPVLRITTPNGFSDPVEFRMAL
jgi:predicted MPP superfamily phosphohydrolase